MDTEYNVSGSVIIDPIWWKDPPKIKIGLDETVMYDGLLEKTQQIDFSTRLRKGSHRLYIEFTNKTDEDTQGHLDKAVVIKDISFFGISSQNFVWKGIYEPCYPQGWIDHLKKDGKIPEARLIYHDYLGWNGIWYLDFDSPVFTWIHQVEHLGWIHD